MAGSTVTMSAKTSGWSRRSLRKRDWISRFSRCNSIIRMARCTPCTSRSSSTVFTKKSKPPRFMHSTAVSTWFSPDTTITGISG